MIARKIAGQTAVWTMTLVLGWILFGGSPRIARGQDEVTAEKRNYDDDGVFARLSSAKQSILELKYGKKNPIATQRTAGSTGPVKPPIAPQSLPANTLVNNPAADATDQDTQSETALVLGSGSNLIAAFNDSGSFTGGASKFTGFARSVNGGTTFTDMGALPTNGADGDAGDPVLARSAKTGTIFLVTLSFNTFQNLELFRSTNDGATFIAPAINSAPGFTSTSGDQDKEWIAVDNFAGPGFGNVYQFWRNFGSPGGMTFTRSTNDGLTWTPNGGLLLANGGQGAWVTVGADHSVYCFWYDDSTAPATIKMRKSIDQGVSFGPTIIVANLLGTGINGDLGLGFRSNSFPQAVASPTNPARLYLVFNDDPPGADRGDVYFTQSNEGGLTWSAPIRVNDDMTPNDNWQPCAAITPDGTKLLVSWYDRRLDPGNSMIDVFTAIANISGASTTFGCNSRITDQAFPAVYSQDPVINFTYMGDYDTAVADNNFFYRTWGDNRLPLLTHTNQPDVRFAKIPVSGVGAVVVGAGTSLVSEAFLPLNGAIDPGEPVTVNFTLQNSGDVSTTNLVATLQATGGVTPSAPVSQTYGSIPCGSSAAMPFSFIGNGACGGSITATLQLQDGPTNLGTVSFPFTMGATKAVSFSGGGITIPSSGAGTPYPSTISVAGVTGAIGSITVTLTDLTHTWPDDMDFLLVGPGGQKSILLSDAGGFFPGPANPVTLTFDAKAASGVGNSLVSGTFKPTDLEPGDVFPAGPAAGPYVADLSVFDGLSGASVNGSWRLYCADDTLGDGGSMGGWTITFLKPSCATQSRAGVIDIDKVRVQCSDSFTVSVSDMDLRGAGSINVNISCSTGDTLSLTLIETPPNSGVLSASVITAPGAPAPDGVLQVSNGATITATYNDADNGTGSPAIMTDAAATDCAVPVISNVSITNIGCSGFTVTFNTNEPTTASVRVGLSCGAANFTGASPLGTSHAVTFGGLNPSTPYFVSVAAADQVGNQATDDNGGICYGVTTCVPNPICPGPFAIAGSLDGSDQTQTGRLTRDLIASSCAAPKVCPGLFDSAPEKYDAYPFVNNSGSTICVNVKLSAGTTCADQIESAAYLGVFDPANLCTGYLADAGNSPVPPGSVSYSFNVGAGQTFTVVVNAVSGGDCADYTLDVNGNCGITPTPTPTPAPPCATFSNTSAITINDSAAASPYPSNITVTGLSGPITRVTVDLVNFSHSYPSDVDMILVAPNGLDAILMSDIGDGIGVSNLNLTFDQSAAASLPTPLVSGTFRPADLGVGDSFFPPAPIPSGGRDLAVFNVPNGAVFNGTWSLYVVDDLGGDAGTIQGGWRIHFAAQSCLPPNAARGWEAYE